MEKQNKMAVMPMKELLFNMSLPLMLSLLIQSLYNIVDGIYVSRLSENALTATSLAYPVQFMMIAISVGTTVGLNALMSRYTGSGDSHKACT
ncbi:MAG: MATE family efflux transporter, partial [Erysipelotrichaceae bacterium]|nr:MATE family efflux transporter [Erysipelotrichaceae bacterium]